MTDMNIEKENYEHDFSLELKSSRSLSRLLKSNKSEQEVLIEGTLGKHLRASFLESTILEVQGENGILRLSIRKDDIIIPKDEINGATKEVKV